jgi:tRNA threonylcarbamoyl adenosine modification protein (Sua5/YciO/YrdC/YwlC family)
MHIFEHLRLHPERPQIRQIRRAVEFLRQGYFLVVPTETTYALVCNPHAVDAMAAIRKLRNLDDSHLWAVLCADLSQAAGCARVDNQAHRLLKRCLPGPYTFILPASSMLPKRIFGKRRDVGIRIPQHEVCRSLLQEYGDILLITTFAFPGDSEAAHDADDFVARIKHLSCAVLDAGWCGLVPTTVVDLCAEEPLLVREGMGEWPA